MLEDAYYNYEDKYKMQSCRDAGVLKIRRIIRAYFVNIYHKYNKFNAMIQIKMGFQNYQVTSC